MEYFNLEEAGATRLSWIISLPVARQNAAETAFCASEDRETASRYHEIPYDEPDLQTATYFDRSYFQTSDDDDRKFRRLVQDLELRIAKVEGGTARRWTRKDVEEKSRAAEKAVRGREKEEGLRGRVESGAEGEGALAKEAKGDMVVRPKWTLVQTSICEYGGC